MFLEFKQIGSLAGNLMLKHSTPTFASDVFVLLETVGAFMTIRKFITLILITLAISLTHFLECCVESIRFGLICLNHGSGFEYSSGRLTFATLKLLLTNHDLTAPSHHMGRRISTIILIYFLQFIHKSKNNANKNNYLILLSSSSNLIRTHDILLASQPGKSFAH